MFNLKLTAVKSKLNNLVLYETIDEKLLKKIINSDLLLNSFHNPTADFLYSDEKKQLIEYKKLIKKGKAKITYKKPENIDFGRSNPIKALGLFCIRRQIRQTLSKNNYIDIDIENCHPNILLQICKYYKIKCDNLNDYVVNRSRHLNNIMETYKVSKDDAKKLIIRILYFGSFDNWAKDLKIDAKPIKFLVDFKKEINEIGKIIYDNNDDIRKAVEKRKEEQNKKNYNKIGSVVSYYLQEIECRILETIYLFCVENGYIRNNNCVLCADGLMIEKDLFNPELLTIFNKLIKDTFDLDLKFTTKEMNEDYLNIIDEHIINDFKKYEPLTKDYDIDTIKYNNNYVYDEKFKGEQYNQDVFNKYSTIIIKSTTGTGKTSNTAKFCKKSNKYILSIVTRISLVNQHIESFKKEGINLYDYREKDDLFNRNLVICINSLMMLNRLSDNELKNYIVYIDEISSFLETLTHNNNLNGNLKLINNILMRIIKNCHKIIVSDALISDNVFELLKFRNDNEKVFIINEFRKYKDVKAYDIKNEENFLNMINNKCLNNEPFLFGCDSKAIITQYFNYCLSYNEDKKDKFILITSETKVEFNDTNEFFKDKYVFYSPSITFGIDFNVENAQDVFIYINGNSILPSGSFQQTTRTRNINNLYFYVNEKEVMPKYDNLDEVKNYYKDFITESDQLLNISSYTDEEDNLKIVENTFFNLFCYNEYVKDIYETNKYLHYREILKENNFEIIDEDVEKSKLSKEIKNEMKDLDNIEDLINEYIDDDNKDNNKYSVINEFRSLFNLHDIEELPEFKDYIGNKYKIDDVLNFNRFIKKDDFIDAKINVFNQNTYKIKGIESIYYKIKFVNQIFKNNNLEHFDIKNINDFKISEKDYNLSKKLFRSTKKCPTNEFEIKKMVVDWYKNILGESIIKTTTSRNSSNKRTYSYDINNDVIQEYLKITRNLNKNDIKEEFIKKFDIKASENDVDFLED